MINFEPRVGKVQTDQTSGGFAVIIPFFFFNLKKKVLNIVLIAQWGLGPPWPTCCFKVASMTMSMRVFCLE